MNSFSQHASASSVRCIGCGYDLTGATIGSVCPECGMPIEQSLKPRIEPRSSGTATASMVIGILSLTVCALLGPVAIALAMNARSEMKHGGFTQGSSTMASAGLILGIISTGLMCLIVPLLALGACESTSPSLHVIHFAAMEYQSNLPYDPQRIHAAAVYCSDGRVGEHFDDFLQNSLRLPRYDRVALPGGPACLAGHTEAHVAEQGVVDELKFLVEAHGLERIVLIAHAGCAFYSARLQLPEEYLEPQQKIDLVKAAGFIRRITGISDVDAFFARPQGMRVTFEPVQL